MLGLSLTQSYSYDGENRQVGQRVSKTVTGGLGGDAQGN
jgi:hypothetical protein